MDGGESPVGYLSFSRPSHGRLSAFQRAQPLQAVTRSPRGTPHPRGLEAGEGGTWTVPSDSAGGRVRGRTSQAGRLLPWDFLLNPQDWDQISRSSAGRQSLAAAFALLGSCEGWGKGPGDSNENFKKWGSNWLTELETTLAKRVLEIRMRH